MLPLSATRTSPAILLSLSARFALRMQMAKVSASLRQGITTETSTVWRSSLCSISGVSVGPLTPQGPVGLSEGFVVLISRLPFRPWIERHEPTGRGEDNDDHHGLHRYRIARVFDPYGERLNQGRPEDDGGEGGETHVPAHALPQGGRQHDPCHQTQKYRAR